MKIQPISQRIYTNSIKSNKINNVVEQDSTQIASESPAFRGVNAKTAQKLGIYVAGVGAASLTASAVGLNGLGVLALCAAILAAPFVGYKIAEDADSGKSFNK